MNSLRDAPDHRGEISLPYLLRPVLGQLVEDLLLLPPHPLVGPEEEFAAFDLGLDELFGDVFDDFV